jgi:hypothetical protein
VAVVVYDGITPFELGVACDVFGAEWEEMFDTAWYRLFVCAISPGPRHRGRGIPDTRRLTEPTRSPPPTR